MIVIEQNHRNSEPIGRALKYSNIECIGWNSHAVPLFKMAHEAKPRVLVYNSNSKIDSIQTLRHMCPTIQAIVYMGETPSQVDISISDVIMSSMDFKIDKLLSIPTNIYDTVEYYNVPGKQDKDMICEAACFTDFFTQEGVNKITGLLSYMCSQDVRFFGSQKLETPNYLGQVTPDDRGNILKSCQVYIDLTGNMWPLAVTKNCPVVVMSENPIGGIPIFDDPNSLAIAISEAKSTNDYLDNFNEIIKSSSGFDVCFSLLSRLGSEVAAQSVMESKLKIQMEATI